MTHVDDRVLDSITQTIVSTIDPDTVYLFGSRARGDASEDSDVDIAVVKDTDFRQGASRYQQLALLIRATGVHRVPLDILLYSHEEFDALRLRPSHVVHDIALQGRVLYGRP